jgi:hypothetical protein
MTKDEALKQALEALVYASSYCDTYDAIDAIKQALAVPVQEPVQDSTCNETLRGQGKAYPRTCKKCGLGPCIGAPKQPPAQPAPVQKRPQNCGTGYCSCVECVMEPAPVQEPMHPDIKKLYEDYFDKCFRDSSLPQRTWVGLMRGVRVDGDTVVITVKGGNDAARELCGDLLNEMEAYRGND